MSLLVSIAAQAEADVARQYQWYFQNTDIKVADRFLADFNDTVNKLAKHPGLGRQRKFRARELADIRSFPIGGSFAVLLVFYYYTADTLLIERVMHGARDLPRRLLQSPEI